jgi:hypothetical protein
VRESKVEGHLIKRVGECRGETRKVEWIGRNHAPDRRVMLPGYCCWVETKASGKKAREAQAREHERMRKYGEIVYVINTTQGVDNWLANLGFL